jgi:hypothetical protein
MSNGIGAKPANVQRIVFKQIVYGDFRKFEAQSNDAHTGGGARDLRFRPYEEFAKVFCLLFPTVRTEQRRRGGRRVDVAIQVGHLYWFDKGKDAAKEATFEPPTDVRPREGRLPIVHTYPPFNRIVQIWPENSWEEDRRALKVQGRLVLLLVQRDDGSVWAEFATEKSLNSGAWEDSVASPILRTLNAKRRSKQVARGYVDFVSGEEYSDD